MTKTLSLIALLGLTGSAVWAQKSAVQSIEEYRLMLQDGNPADLFEAKG
ncbi:MAG TPA: sulfur oxidation c-type cytochrome SoxA, partial [Burkholderiaceae bacterium]|nr:sulfur oxidation c-type cytochrome SoxA [Burkholderiaceae bacterium]